MSTTLDHLNIDLDGDGIPERYDLSGGSGGVAELPANLVYFDESEEEPSNEELSSVLKTESSPIGTVIAFMGTKAPKDFLACDGAIYEINKYPKLAAFFLYQFGSYNKFGGDGTTTFAVPDLRGEFLRGTGTNSHSNQGNGEAVGVHQDGTEHGKTAAYDNTIFAFVNGTHNYPNKVDSVAKKAVTVKGVGINTSSSINDISLYTSRPTNTSVLYCIKYDDHADAVGKKMHAYSTEEQVVGIWIDGKPIYEKTFKMTSVKTFTVQTWTELFEISSDIELMFSKSFGNNQSYNNLKYWINKTTNMLAAMSTHTKDTWSTSNLWYITIQYTKTTD